MSQQIIKNILTDPEDSQVLKSKLKLITATKPKETEWWEDSSVIVSYASSKVNEILTELMATNVIRLSNQRFMTRLSNAVSLHHENKINQRCKERKMKEIKRVHKLFFDDPSTPVPFELKGNIILNILKKVERETNRRRSKYLNKQEEYYKNKCREVKHIVENIGDTQIQKGKQYEKYLEELYKKENSLLGLDLLRIKNDRWKYCESGLRNFLKEQEQKYRKNKIVNKTKDKKMKKKILKKFINKNEQQEKPEKILQEFNENLSESELSEEKFFSDVKYVKADTGILKRSYQSTMNFTKKDGEILLNYDENILPKFKDPRITQLENSKDIYEFVQVAQNIVRDVY